MRRTNRDGQERQHGQHYQSSPAHTGSAPGAQPGNVAGYASSSSASRSQYTDRSQNISSRLKEFKAASSVKSEPGASGQWTSSADSFNAGQRPLGLLNVKPEDQANSRTAGNPRFQNQNEQVAGPPWGPAKPFPAPVFNPSAPPPGLPPFSQPPAPEGRGSYGATGPGHLPPPPLPPTFASSNNFGNVPSPNSFGNVPPPNSFGNVPPPNSFGNVPPPNSFGNVPPPNSFGNVPPPNSFGNVPPPNSFGNVPPPNSFGNIPPPNSFGNVPPPNNFGSGPTQNNFCRFPPQPPNYGSGPPPNSFPGEFGNVPPPNNFAMGPPPMNFGNVPPINSFGNIPPSTNFNAPAGSGFSSVPPRASSNIPPAVAPPSFPGYPSPSKGQPSVNAPTVGGGLAQMEDEPSRFGAQQEVDQWLLKKGKRKGEEKVSALKSPDKSQEDSSLSGQDAKEKEPENSFSIADAHTKLRSVLHGLAAVQGELQQMEEEQETMDAARWKDKVLKVKQLKESYFEVKQKLDVEQLKDLNKKLHKRKKKRENEKRRKEADREAEEQTLFERAHKHALMDQWCNQTLQKHLDKQQVKKMKETADKTLSKVRREIREARKMLDTIERLGKLRSVRSDTAEKRGQTFPASVGEHFTEKSHDLSQLLLQQIEACEKEEAALKLILETEKEEAKEKEEAEKRQKEKRIRLEEMQEENISLFGQPVSLYPGDPMQPYFSYYQQSQYNLQSLQNIRHDWDRFLVAEHTPMASRIPDGWALPEPPSSKAWASVLQGQ